MISHLYLAFCPNSSIYFHRTADECKINLCMAILCGLSNLGQSMFTFILKSKLITNRQNEVLDIQHQGTTRRISYKYSNMFQDHYH